MPEHPNERTRQALNEIETYTENTDNEPPSFSLSRLTDDLFTDSFLAGGALINPSGSTVISENAQGSVLASGGGAPSAFPIELSIDLTTAGAAGKWTLPDGTSQTPSFHVSYLETVNRPEGRLLLFAGVGHADGAAYSVTILLI